LVVDKHFFQITVMLRLLAWIQNKDYFVIEKRRAE